MNFERETLTKEQQYNEYILTSLRTMWGTNLNYIEQNFGKEFLNHCVTELKIYLDSKDLAQRENKLFLTDKGKLLADKISSDLFKLK